MKRNSDATKLLVEERAAIEREKSNTLYALKVVEHIVFTIVGVASLGALYALLKLVIVTPVISSVPIP